MRSVRTRRCVSILGSPHRNSRWSNRRPGSQQPAQGIDGTLPAEGNRSTPRRRYRPVPRCSRWSGSDLHAVGKIAWDSRDWNSIDCGESANRSPSGLHSGSQLQHGRLRRTHLRVDWWPGSKGCLRLGRQGYVPGLTRGTETPRHAVQFGKASGFPEPISPFELAPRALYLTWAILPHYNNTPETLAASSADLFHAIQSGILKVDPTNIYRFDQLIHAHQQLEQRRTVGATVLHV